MRYRLYVDESGDHTYRHLEDISGRYLALIGVAIEADYYRNQFQPEFEALKQAHFPHSPDEPIVLHREDIYNRRHSFGRLDDPALNAAWEAGLTDFVLRAQFRLLTVVIDKKAHRERYGDSAMHPYHLGLTFLMERFRGYLMYVGGKGDILAESRGAPEDLALKRVYEETFDQGTYFISAQEFQKVLTTRQLKLKKKEHNIAGLQLADMLAHPAKMELLFARGKIASLGSTFGTRLAGAFRNKYDLIGRKLLD